MNDSIILLQAKLDEAKSKTTINADLTRLQAKLNKLKLQAEIDPKSLLALTKQLEEILDQKIVLPEIIIDRKTVTKEAGQIGRQAGDSLNQGLQDSLQNSKKLSINWSAFPLKEKIASSLKDLKEVNRLLIEISKTAQNVSKADLSALGASAFSTAGKYGQKASGYLTGIQEMSLAGYDNAEELAELGLLAQTAGNLDAGLSRDYLLAMDAAYQLKGNVEALTTVLDGQTQVTAKNALSMKDLAEATKLTASQAASSGISIEESTAALSAMLSATRQGGNEIAQAWRGILMNLQQIEGQVGDGEILDPEALAKSEQACANLGVALKEVKNGEVFLRDPMVILEELSAAYASLEASDARRANLIDAIGGNNSGGQLRALLENWTLYEKMLEDYTSGSGTAMEMAMQSANGWEGALNRLSNTFTKVVNNFVDSDFVVGVTNGFNGLLSVVDKITAKLGALGSIGVGAGLFAGLKNAGGVKCSPLI